MSDAQKFLSEGRIPAAKFTTIDDVVAGVITEPPVMQQQRDFKTKEPMVWDDGTPRSQLVVTLQTEQFDGFEDDGRRRVYIKGQMRSALWSALKNAGASDLEPGGHLRVTYTGDGEARNGLNPPKLYSITYEPPTSPIGAGELGETIPF